jgi:hypothetical protein
VGRDKVSIHVLLQDMPHHTHVSRPKVEARTTASLPPLSNIFQKHGFQRGGITLLNHAERVWESSSKPTPQHRGPSPSAEIYPLDSALPPPILSAFCCCVSVGRFDYLTSSFRFLQPVYPRKELGE